MSFNVSSKTYALPTITDLEYNDTTLGVTGLPSFASFDNALKLFTFTPTLVSQVGTYTISIMLSDWQPLMKSYSISVSVTNSLPQFDTALVNQTVPLNGSPVTYSLPTYSDADGGLVTMVVKYEGSTTFPSFISLVNNSTVINPGKYDFTAIGSYKIDLTLTDDTNQS